MLLSSAILTAYISHVLLMHANDKAIDAQRRTFSCVFLRLNAALFRAASTPLVENALTFCDVIYKRSSVLLVPPASFVLCSRAFVVTRALRRSTGRRPTNTYAAHRQT